MCWDYQELAHLSMGYACVSGWLPTCY